MYRVVIVDDEAIVRIGLKSMINWEKHGFQIVGEASNGQKGLDLIREEKPDITFVDIKMPVVDGIEMIKSSMELNHTTKFIVLSSYDDFDLVKKAMKLGAEDYLLKLELEANDLIETLTEVTRKLDEEFEEEERQKKTKQIFINNKEIIQEKIFFQLMSGTLTEQSDIEHKKSSLDMNIDEGNLLCILVKLSYSENKSLYHKDDIEMFTVSINSIIKEIVNDIFEGYSFKWKDDEFIAVFSYKNDELAIRQKNINNLTERLNQMLQKYFNVYVSIGLSNEFSGLVNIIHAYQEAALAVRYSFFIGNNKTIRYSEIGDRNNFEENVHIYRRWESCFYSGEER